MIFKKIFHIFLKTKTRVKFWRTLSSSSFGSVSVCTFCDWFLSCKFDPSVLFVLFFKNSYQWQICHIHQVLASALAREKFKKWIVELDDSCPEAGEFSEREVMIIRGIIFVLGLQQLKGKWTEKFWQQIMIHACRIPFFLMLEGSHCGCVYFFPSFFSRQCQHILSRGPL